MAANASFNCFVDIPYISNVFCRPLTIPIPPEGLSGTSCGTATSEVSSALFFDFLYSNFQLPPPSEIRLHVNGCPLYQNTSIPLHRLLATHCSSSTDTAANGAPLHWGILKLSVLYRLFGGKGGFGATLKGEKGKRRKITNLDACRDLSGRRIRHTKAVDRLRTWLERKRQDDELVAALTGNETGEATPSKDTKRSNFQDVKLDESFLAEMQDRGVQMRKVVKEGIINEKLREEALAKKKQKVTESTRSTKSLQRKSNWYLYSSMLSDAEDSEDEERISEVNNGRVSNQKVAEVRRNDGGEKAMKTIAGSTQFESISTDEVSRKLLPQTEALNKVADSLQTHSEGAPNSTVDAAPSSDTNGTAISHDESVEKVQADKKSVAQTEVEEYEIDIGKYKSATELARDVSPNMIKLKLQQLGLKCGGKPEERAERLFLLKHLTVSQLPPNAFAKPSVMKTN